MRVHVHGMGIPWTGPLLSSVDEAGDRMDIGNESKYR